jgi:GIY-YIG catalytic domain-containing protein
LLPATSGIYKILNTINGKVYIGSAVNMMKRRTSHLSQLRKGNHHSHKLQLDWCAYGSGAFVFEIVEECLAADRLNREQHHLDQNRAVEIGYNVALCAEAPMTGRRVSEATKKLIGTANSKTLLERLSSKYIVDKETGCWIWSGGIRGDGRPILPVQNDASSGKKTKYQNVHAARVAYEMFVGPLPETGNNASLVPACKNKLCINPSHMSFECVRLRGDFHYCATLSDEDVRDIRRSELSVKALARLFDAHPSTITSIQKWRYRPAAGGPGPKPSRVIKLTEAAVLKILSDQRPQREIATSFGVTKSAIKHIKRGRCWKHLTQVEIPNSDEIDQVAGVCSGSPA